jgi:hypothetical protein
MDDTRHRPRKSYWYDEDNNLDWTRVGRWAFVTPLALILIVAIAWMGLGAVSRWNKERNIATERKDITITAEAEADAAEARTISEVAQAERQAERDRIRAQGQADATEIIQGSLTPEYLQWYWIDGVRETDAQLIYVPVDPATGIPTLPVTEAGRAVEP